ncbi:hypothetical protein Enr17x_45620 [Gimesia fumaroli]|uniref:Uncharacterized protein n=1 Tax=Gimesia fumaroli TaxID=2527976 RepID=A0A518IHD2_9PLAN|nr:hypothetical protein Enr17x_45620 [Gimesia fumaroli]
MASKEETVNLNLKRICLFFKGMRKKIKQHPAGALRIRIVLFVRTVITEKDLFAVSVWFPVDFRIPLFYA